MANLSEQEPMLIGNSTVTYPAKAGRFTGGDTESVTVPLLVPVADLAGSIPDQGAPYTGDRAILGNALGFKSARWAGKVGDRVLLDLEYAVAPDGSAGSVGDGGVNPEAIPEDQIYANDAGLEVPLPRHPLWSTSSPTLDDDSLEDLWDEDLGRLVLPAGHSGIALGLQGMSAYMVGSYSVTHTEYFNGSPTSIIGTVGTRAIPPGEGGSTENWLVVSGSKREPDGQNTFGSRTLIYLYSDDPGFPTGVYT